MPGAAFRQFHQAAPIVEGDGQGLFQQHMLAGLERCTSETGVFRHGGQNEHDIHLGAIDHLLIGRRKPFRAQGGQGRFTLTLPSAGHHDFNLVARP